MNLPEMQNILPGIKETPEEVIPLPASNCQKTLEICAAARRECTGTPPESGEAGPVRGEGGDGTKRISGVSRAQRRGF